MPPVPDADLADHLDIARPHLPAGERTTLSDGAHPGVGEPAPCGPFLPDAWLAAAVEGFVVSHGKAFAADLRDDPVALRHAALDVLVAFDLVRRVPGGVVARPAIARYRDVRVETAPGPQLSLLDAGTAP